MNKGNNYQIKSTAIGNRNLYGLNKLDTMKKLEISLDANEELEIKSKELKLVQWEFEKILKKLEKGETDSNASQNLWIERYRSVVLKMYRKTVRLFLLNRASNCKKVKLKHKQATYVKTMTVLGEIIKGLEEIESNNLLIKTTEEIQQGS